jgi:ribosomal protein S27E
MEKTVKCWGCGNDEFTMEKHPDYDSFKESCCTKCGRYLLDRNGVASAIGIKVKNFKRTKVGT